MVSNYNRELYADEITNDHNSLQNRITDISDGKVVGNIPSFLEKTDATPDIYYIRQNEKMVTGKK
jgi:hypothetical protein